jgi:hypothetical protein
MHMNIDNSDEDLVLSDPVKQAQQEVSDFLWSVRSTKKSNLQKSSLKSSFAKGSQPSRHPVLFQSNDGLSNSSSGYLLPIS